MKSAALITAAIVLICYCFFLSLDHYLKTPAAINAAITELHTAR